MTASSSSTPAPPRRSRFRGRWATAWAVAAVCQAAGRRLRLLSVHAVRQKKWCPGEDWVIDARGWVRRWNPVVGLRWLWCRHRRASMLAAIVVALWLPSMGRAWADPGTGADSGNEGNVLIAWMGIQDSDWVPVAKYTLTMNWGGWTEPHVAIFAFLASIYYEIYLCITTTALWLIKFVLSFDWLAIFAKPFVIIGDGVNDSMARFGLAATALAVMAIIVVFTVLAGRTAKAFSNFAMGLLMFGLAATIFANPLAEMIGSDGLLAQGRDTGLQIATEVSGGTVVDSGDGGEVDAMVEQLADRFLRAPTQMINFGVVSDSVSRQCREAWSSGIENDRGDELKEDIKGCDDVEGEAMHQNSMGSPAAMLVPISICSVLAMFLVAFACYFVWHIVRTAIQAMLYAVLAPPAFAIGVIPGGPQTFAWKTVLDCAMAYAAMIVYTAAFGAYNVILDSVFNSTNNVVQAMFLTALVLVFAFAFLGPLRRMFDRQRDTMAAKLGRGSVSDPVGSRLSRIADLSRAKQEIGDQFGWGHGGRGSARRSPGRVDTGVDTSTGGGGGGGGGGGDPVTTDDRTDTSGPAPASTGLAASSGAPAGGGGTVGGGSEGVGTAAPPRPQHTTQSVAFVEGQRAAQAHDRLAEAIRLKNAWGRPSSGGPPGLGGAARHALSEAA